MKPCKARIRLNHAAAIGVGYSETQCRNRCGQSPAAAAARMISAVLAPPVEIISGLPNRATWAISLVSTMSNEEIL